MESDSSGERLSPPPPGVIRTFQSPGVRRPDSDMDRGIWGDGYDDKAAMARRMARIQQENGVFGMVSEADRLKASLGSEIPHGPQRPTRTAVTDTLHGPPAPAPASAPSSSVLSPASPPPATPNSPLKTAAEKARERTRL